MSVSRFRRPAALGATASLAVAALLATGSAVSHAQSTADCGLFDDFAYSGPDDPQLNARGWSVRTEAGGPGVPGASWPAGNISFPADGAQQNLRLSAVTDGTAEGTSHAELRHQQKFFEGSYAARVRFSDAPVDGTGGDHLVQTFYTITPLDFDNDPDYSEVDFEYLPHGGWGDPGPILYETTWETYQPDPWVADNIHDKQSFSHDGWKDLLFTIADGHVKYYVDGQLVADHADRYYPEQDMSINFNLWLIDLAGHSGGTSTWVQDIDWVYFAEDQVESQEQVSDSVAGYRADGIDHLDTVGGC